MARESGLGQGLGLGTSNGGVAQVVVDCVRGSGRRGGVLEDLVTSVGCDGQGDLCQGRNKLTGI